MGIPDLPDVGRLESLSYGPELHEDTALFRSVLENCQDYSFVARTADAQKALAGYLLAYATDPGRDDFEEGWRPCPSDSCTAIYIHDMCVHPDFRERSIARLLFSALEKKAAENGIPSLIGIAVQNSERFWYKLGFETVRPCSYHGEPGVFISRPV